MKTYIAISVLDSNHSLGETINRLLKSSVGKDIFVFDLTPNGLDSELKRFVKSYNNLRVFLVRVKRAGKVSDRNERINIGISESLMKFNSIKSGRYDTYIHLYQGIMLEAGDLLKLVDNTKVWHSLSPVIETYNGIEVLKGIFDRYGFEKNNVVGDILHFITGEVEESFALNPKCFALTRLVANKLCDFTHSHRSPESYLNTLVVNNTSHSARVDTNLFVHEHLY